MGFAASEGDGKASMVLPSPAFIVPLFNSLPANDTAFWCLTLVRVHRKV